MFLRPGAVSGVVRQPGMFLWSVWTGARDQNQNQRQSRSAGGGGFMGRGGHMTPLASLVPENENNIIVDSLE